MSIGSFLDGHTQIQHSGKVPLGATPAFTAAQTKRKPCGAFSESVEVTEDSQERKLLLGNGEGPDDGLNDL